METPTAFAGVRWRSGNIPVLSLTALIINFSIGVYKAVRSRGSAARVSKGSQVSRWYVTATGHKGFERRDKAVVGGLSGVGKFKVSVLESEAEDFHGWTDEVGKARLGF